ncbi:MAG: IPT/TIG domain-containing protein [Anaerolineae bacterium]|nr:IPT/TIG domain-containing protein [Anaerolineae bacterium]
MKKFFSMIVATSLPLVALVVVFGILVAGPAQAAPLKSPPVVTQVDPSSAPNDLETAIVITGSNFTAELSGTVVITPPTVQVGSTTLVDVGWVSSATLTATVPWGLQPGVYPLTVTNPDGASAGLSNAFTVTQAIGIWTTGGPYGGTINQLALNPLLPTTLYARAFDVGIFRSRDAGDSWVFVFADRNTSALAVDPLSPNRVYANHGQAGPYRSDNEGDTWTPIPISPSLWAGGGTPSHFQIYPHPTSPGVIYGTAQSVPGTPNPGTGLVKSVDYGQTWASAMTGLTDTEVAALAFHPTNPLTMYLATENGYLFRTANGGDSWTFASRPVTVTADVTIIGLAVNPFSPHEVWIGSDYFTGCPAGAIIKKSTGSDLTTWSPVEIFTGQPSCASMIVFDPATANRVFIAGHSGNHQTVDGGANWTSFGPNNLVTDFALPPTIPNTIFASDSQYGVWKTTNNGTDWTIVNQGLAAIRPKQLAVAPGHPEKVYALVDGWPGVFKTDSGGGAWQFLENGIQGSSSLLLDPFIPGRAYYGTNEKVYISSDGGVTWPISGTLMSPPQYAGCWLWPQVLKADPLNSGVLLAGIQHACGSAFSAQGSIYKSANYGAQWTRMSFSQEISQVTDLAFDPINSNVVYAATSGSGLFKSTNNGDSWLDIGAQTAELRLATDILVEPTSPYRVFAGNGSGVYRSSDGGVSWQMVGQHLGLQVEQLYFAGIPPTLALYQATTTGLFRSFNLGNSWQRAAGALGYANVNSLAAGIAAERVILYAGTAGGSVTTGGMQLDGMAEETLVEAGIYRYTSETRGKVYLPTIFKN